jgi:hypothetical protein
MPRRLLRNLLSPTRTGVDCDPVLDAYLQSRCIEIEYPLILNYHSFHNSVALIRFFSEASIDTIGTTRFRGVIRNEGCSRANCGGLRVRDRTGDRISGLRSSCATSAFRGAEMGAKRFIRRKTSCVPVSVPAHTSPVFYFKAGRAGLHIGTSLIMLLPTLTFLQMFLPLFLTLHPPISVPMPMHRMRFLALPDASLPSRNPAWPDLLHQV